MNIPPTPLLWPASFKRTGGDHRKPGRFTMSFPKALASLHAAMKRRGLARHDYVITSNLPLKQNGDPTPVGSGYGEQGIALYWLDRKSKETRVIACDQFWDARQNLRAIALTAEHLWDMERWGCTQLVEHIMHGFALPGAGATSFGTGEPLDQRCIEPSRDWITAFGLTLEAMIWRDRDLVEKIYRKRALELHPDRANGSGESMASLNVAWEQAKSWYDWNVEYGDGL